VLPVGAAVMLDEPGFLDAAMATAWWVAPEDRPAESALAGVVSARRLAARRSPAYGRLGRLGARSSLIKS
jgi:hypothetical protein